MMSSTERAPRWLKPAIDYGPLAVFLRELPDARPDGGDRGADPASLVALPVAWVLERRVPVVPLLTAAIVAVFGGLTLWLQDETFIKMKPTIVQALFALILLGGLACGRPLLKPLLAPMMPPMSERAWRQFTLRYALFFVAMAGLNELVWRTQSTDFWVTFKVFGLPVLTVLFILSQLPFVSRATRMAQVAAGSGPGSARSG